MNRMPLAVRRAQLVDAALRVAAQSGVEAVTIRAVAHEAGVSLGTVHYCFHDKDELLDAMGQSISVEASDQIRAAIGAGVQAGLDFPSLLQQCAPALLAGLKRYRQVRLLLLEIATTGARNSALRPTARSHLEQSTQMAYQLVNTLADASGVQFAVDRGVIARITTALIDGIELAWLVDEDDDRALEGFGALADLISGYVAAPSTVSE
ncbi:transcriptional regulator, TetR family [Xylanimonas cellulosilytica DSM 15894]|uniref:Transcriptional regulator, TetR family n=1 Tax=Xylanimonas cellulosilytica (strain DSM 15894 / JCM 12276 / CECT 5975 / KCTC 9989 / LMG 20990 / NBRC 107835 / XIL07) TaxID=446471 RepID=D1BZ65_XYLCX|nr:TetR/AcrR family transcriptional regulator [Xylanimonas cellulosilytica]ACZ31962.1 transcriptional regulator, TetR family [Xylanimonas cellulosilytica DSM 15894]